MIGGEQSRFAEILSGVPRNKSEFARREFARLTPGQLATALRPHFNDTIQGFDLEFRTSFDFILEELQLIEIAVACGYLPLELVKPHVTSEFDTYLKAEAARQYVKDYDYVCVRYLAARVGVDLGLVRLEPLPARPENCVHYAMFLSTYFRFVKDSGIDTFTRMLDDISRGDANARLLAAHHPFDDPALSPGEQRYLQSGSVGYVSFVECLGDFFAVLPEGESGFFGLAFGYWLSHFFGLTRMPNGYAANRVNFALSGYPANLSRDEFSEGEYDAEARRFTERVAVLSRTWDRTRATIEAAARG